LSNFASVNKQVYCKIHYVELFKNCGGKYAVFGNGNFKHQETGAAFVQPASAAVPGAKIQF